MQYEIVLNLVSLADELSGDWWGGLTRPSIVCIGFKRTKQLRW